MAQLLEKFTENAVKWIFHFVCTFCFGITAFASTEGYGVTGACGLGDTPACAPLLEVAPTLNPAQALAAFVAPNSTLWPLDKHGSQADFLRHSAFEQPALPHSPLALGSPQTNAAKCCGDKRVKPRPAAQPARLDSAVILPSSACLGLFLYIVMICRLDLRFSRRRITYHTAKYARVRARYAKAAAPTKRLLSRRLISTRFAPTNQLYRSRLRILRREWLVPGTALSS